jgi:hypothetical protein
MGHQISTLCAIKGYKTTKERMTILHAFFYYQRLIGRP